MSDRKLDVANPISMAIGEVGAMRWPGHLSAHRVCLGREPAGRDKPSRRSEEIREESRWLPVPDSCVPVS